MSAVHIIFICFIPFTGTMNSTNWPAPNVWVFTAQLVEHCSAKAEAMGSIPVESPENIFRVTCTFISFVLRFLSRSVNTHSPSGTRGLHYTTLARLPYSWMIPPRCCKHLVSLWDLIHLRVHCRFLASF